jgi:predicted nucleotidyltransferase
MTENIIKINSEKISEICQRYKISELAIFGSVLRGDYNNESDIDLLVEFIPNSGITLFNLVDIKEEFEKLFGREVDIVSKNAIKNSKNYIRKKAILDNYKVIYIS